ncbi:restriction endonuclease subunit S [Endozoicomonas sp. GU-1]|uniref:restriction endonuclease subunit S n=1 Tax=Endozoicomonas sp. GU-1 TaxID=3009078 RepID=UPI0022B5B913|nr:restriction endonuclease subunit S [Endozoicomonas sp. GU-1]WBA81977.1 restriction endonuclease subunit S [Endozoicomonas sp. GU-1]WBA84927.1 restriction endonuclease subunit S [Endozoicomonas sp. GU-1]
MIRQKNRIPLTELITLQRGFDLPERLRKPGSVPVVASTSINGFHSEAKVSPPGVVIGRSGSIGGGQYITEPFWPLNTTLWVKDFNGHHPKFIYYFLRSVDFTRFNAGSGVPTLNRNHLGSILAPNLSIGEEESIADFLSTYDHLIENNRRRIQLLEESARLLYQEWFVHLRFPGHEHAKITDGLPEGWEKTSASNAMEIMSGGTPKTKVAEYWNGSIPFFTPKDTTDCAFTFSTEKTLTELGLDKCNSKLYPKYTVFITARGTVGKLSFAQQPMAMNQSCYALEGKNEISQQFLYCSLKSSIEQFRARASGSVFDAIVVDTFHRIPFLRPTQPLINEFTEIVGQTFEQVDKLALMNRKLTQARDLLLPRLMNGELTP